MAVSDLDYDDSLTGYHIALCYTLDEKNELLVGYADLGNVDVEFTAVTEGGASLRSALAQSYPSSGNGFSVSYRYVPWQSENMRLLTELGVFAWEFGLGSSEPDTNSDRNNVDLTLALGFDRTIGNGLVIGLGYRYYALDGESVDGISALLRYTFSD